MKMLRLVVIYGANTALTRAITLLSALFLSRYYTLNDVGVYGLAYTFSQLVLPIVSLNASAAVVREGVAEPKTAVNLVRLFAFVAATFALLAAIGGVVIERLPAWALFGLLLGAADVLQGLLVAQFQSRERPWSALVLTLLRVAGVLASVGLAHARSLTIDELLRLQVAWSFLLGGVALVSIRMPDAGSILESASVRSALVYSAITVPHSIALWLISGSDRMWLARLEGTSAVGLYTLAYTVAQASLVLNSGVAAAMGARVAADYEHWRAPGTLTRFLALIGRLTIGILVGSLVVVHVDRAYLHIVRWPPNDVFIVASIATAGFFISNFYICYAAFLFYHRNTWSITIGTLTAAPITVGLMYLLVRSSGVIGAAVGSVLGYLLMAGMYLSGLRGRSGEFHDEWKDHAMVAIRYVGVMAAIGVVSEYWVG
jgi:Membrane protein involved in the export of O-antigen and teichoic acid